MRITQAMMSNIFVSNLRKQTEAMLQRQEQIARAVELGLGVAGADAIDLVTGDADSEALARSLRPILATG